MSLKESEVVRLLMDVLRRVEILEEQVIGSLPSALDLPETPEKPAPKKKKSKTVQAHLKEVREGEEFDLDLSKLGAMSTTEIAQICNKMGHTHASRALHREDLITLLVGEDINIEDPLEEHRRKTFEFVQNNQQMLTSVLSCDMHCPTCPHRQVVECWTDNKDLVS